jgi:hypothetical protein
MKKLFFLFLFLAFGRASLATNYCWNLTAPLPQTGRAISRKRLLMRAGVM